MAYEANNYSHLLGKLKGISDETLQNHFKLYQGYVKNTNLLLETLDRLQSEGKSGTPEFAETIRRFGFEFDGMRLHELYFENLSGQSGGPDRASALYRKMEQDFGSFDRWQEQMMATAKIRGVGWAILYYDSKADRLLNVWINEHQNGHLAGERPILVLDVWEHAYFLDCQTERPKYLQAFFDNIDWQAVSRHFEWSAGTMRKAA